MNYYEMRSRVHQELKTFLYKREEMVSQKLNPPKLSDFMTRMVAQYGVTNRMVKSMIEDLVPGSTVKDGEIVKKNDDW